MPKRLPLLLLLFFIAFALRTFDLTGLPPGLTHDEANHGREAIGVLDGIFLFYFPLNYGSEPLYSYTVAGSMLLFGKNLLSLRLVNVFFSLGTMGIVYLWTTRVFNRRTALLTLALTAVSFWPLASSREALRAGMLPFFMVGSVWFFWQMLRIAERVDDASPSTYIWPVLGFALCVTTTLHIYLAARVAWLVFPLFLLYLALMHAHSFRRLWSPTFVGLILAGLLVVPMFVYLENHPEATTRLDMLDRPLQELKAGNLVPLFQNASEAILAFIWPGYGDKFLAYNIPGRPVFDTLSAVFFVLGIFTTLWRWKQPRYAFLILWFFVGISPSIITGPTANTTRNLAAMPAVYLLPVIGFLVFADQVTARFSRLARPLTIGLSSIWILFAAWITVTDYYFQWGQSPEVRGAYQHTLIEGLTYLEQQATSSVVVLSSVYPGPAHDPSIGLVILPQPEFEMRWVDARYAFLFPGNRDALALIPASTPLHPAFAELMNIVESVDLRPDDLDSHFTVYAVEHAPLETWTEGDPVDFDGAIRLMHAHWLSPIIQAGDTAELLTVWRVTNPDGVGPLVPPIYTTDAVLFTQVLDETGKVLAQRDASDAPSWDWQAGDNIIQIHPITVPRETEPGIYDTIVGIYDRQSGERRPVVDENGTVVDTRSFVAPLEVTDP